MTGLESYLASLALLLGLAVRIPNLVGNWRDPLQLSIGVVLLLGSASYGLSAPPSITALNRWTGITNFAAPVVYALICAFSAACLVLLIHWRGGPPAHVRRLTRWWSASYAVVAVVLCLLFAAGDTPVERLTDLDTYYATTPYIGPMIVLYLGAHLVAAVAAATLCWNWSQLIPSASWTRSSLLTLSLGWMLDAAYVLIKLTGIGARWTGHNLDVLSTTIGPRVVVAGSFFVLLGFLMPIVGPPVVEYARQWRTYRQLGALWKLLLPRQQRSSFAVLPRWSSLDLQVLQRETGIRDALRRLSPCFDHRVREESLALARESGADDRTADTIAVAAMIAVAVRASPTVSAERQEGVGPALSLDLPQLERISKAIARSSIVRTVLRSATSERS